MDNERGLNSEQAAAVEYGDGPLRIMAGAGTGKTHTLTHRIVALVQSGRAKPSQILALTFTNKAAEELRERIDKAVSALPESQGERVDIDTYHAFGGRIVTEHGHRIGLPPDPIMLTPPEAWILLWRSLDEVDFRHIDLLHMRGFAFLRSPLYDMLNLGSRLRDELATLEDLERYLDQEVPTDDTAKLGDFLRALQVYERKKRESGAIDYGDQIALACELLDIPAVAAIYQSRYRYMLVDEFQDTNYAQSVLVRRLAGNPAANICVVGDPNQAIYAFRGASPDNLDRFAEEEFPTALTVELRQNFRSTPQILAVANAVWSNNEGPYRGNLVSATDRVAPRPVLVGCEAVEDEIAFIAGEIERQIAAGRHYKNVAIIVRKNTFKGLLFRGLRDRRIPCEVIGGTSLFETPEVREVISYLRAIGNPADDPSVAHVLCAERWGMDEQALYALSQTRQRGEPLIETARRFAGGVEDAHGLSTCVETIDSLTGRSYRIGLGRLVEEIVALRMGGYDPVEQANVQRFVAIVRAFSESRVERPTLADLLVYLELLLTAGPEDEAAGELDPDEANTVKIMTAHASKGLEWPVVFVAGANKSDFQNRKSKDLLPPAISHPAPGRPNRADYGADSKSQKTFENTLKAWEDEQHGLEELRVLYVALTRARELLTITWSRTHPDRVKDVPLLPALELAAELCTRISAEPAAASTSSVPAFRQIAPRLLTKILPFLSGDETNPATPIILEEALTGQWQYAGGAPDIVPAAVDRFFRLRASTEEHLAVIKAIDARNATDGERAVTHGGPISYTQLETFNACPHRYYLRFVTGLPGMPSRGSSAIGTAFHNAIAAEAARRSAGKTVDEPTVRHWFDKDAALAASPPVQDGEGSGSKRDFVGNYLASPDATAEPLLVEAAFSLKIGNSTLRGVIDRVHRLPDGTTEVVDYKTDRRVRTEAEVREGWQLPIYLLACRDVFTDIQPTPTRAVMFFVGANERIPVEYTAEQLEAKRVEIELAANALRAITPNQHTASEATCRWCDFRKICRFAVITE